MSSVLDWIKENGNGAVDLFYGAFLLFGVIRGFFRGLALELAGLIGSGLIFFGAWRFYIPLSEWLLANTRLSSQQTGRLMAYLIVVIFGLILVQIIIVLLKKFFTLAVPGVLQRPGGGVLGGLKSLVILCVLLLAVNLTSFGGLRETLVEGSYLGRATQQWVPAKLEQWFPGLLPESLKPSGDSPDGSGNA